MFKIIILAVGKMKEKYFAAAVVEYLKRLRPYAKIEIKEITAESFSAGSKAQAKKIEGEKIFTALKKYSDSEIILLDEDGKSFNSIALAEKLRTAGRPMVFVIGGALGFEEKLKKHFFRLSLSALTFPHELAQVVLLEQLYRAVTIIKNKDYHY